MTTAQAVNMGTVRIAAPRIDAAEAKAMIEAGEAIVLDIVASYVWPSPAGRGAAAG